MTDFFNYGFTEETWRLYCEKQRKMRYDCTQMNKIVGVSTLTPPTIDPVPDVVTVHVTTVLIILLRIITVCCFHDILHVLQQIHIDLKNLCT